jgi:hypothetical protein
MDLDPDHFPYEHRTPIPDDHVRFAYSIVTAYAVLEQLGLALQAHSFKNKQWVPARKADLENRLQKVGINFHKPIGWLLRGGRTRIERSRDAQTVRKAEWARGAVRDFEAEVVDAIADVRWLRSNVAAHDVKKSASLISINDVANAQFLARRCILACLTPEPT